jgi:hypothetical protein
MTIKFDRFTRVIRRCIEIREQPDIEPVIVTVYDEALAGPASAYLGAVAALTAATSARQQKRTGVTTALALVDAPYRTARSAIKAIHPEYATTTPGTIKAMTTDTDKRIAIERLLGAVQKHAGAPWADALLQGEFGARAIPAIEALDDLVTANSDLSRAKTGRAAAFEPAYERYLDFKKVVREARGARSAEYKRIHLRALPSTRKKGQDDAPDSQAEGE